MPNPKWRTRAKQEWIAWLKEYGLGQLYDAFIRTAQGAESECVHCGEKIYLDIVEGGGVPDWGTAMSESDGLDYGCSNSPDTDDQGTGGHEPVKR